MTKLHRRVSARGGLTVLRLTRSRLILRLFAGELLPPVLEHREGPSLVFGDGRGVIQVLKRSHRILRPGRAVCDDHRFVWEVSRDPLLVS